MQSAALLVVLLVGLRGGDAGVIPGAPYPVGKGGFNASAGKVLYVINPTDDTTRTMVASISGATARNVRPMVYQGSDVHLTYLVETFGVQPVEVANITDLISKVLNEVAGHNVSYVEFQNGTTDPRNAAISMAAREPFAFALTPDVAALTPLRMVANATGASAEDLLPQGGWSKDIMVLSSATPILDYAVFAGAFTFFADPVSHIALEAFVKKAFGTLNPMGAVFGWIGGPPPREEVFVGSANAAHLYTHCADIASNLAVHSQFDIPTFKQTIAPPVPSEDGKHTVAFLYTDGDSLGYDLGYFNSLFNESLRGTFPLGWTMSPAASTLLPASLHHFYKAMTPNDEFVAGPSGVGYAYPDEMPNVATFANVTSTAMRMSSMRTLNIISGNPLKLDIAKYAEPFLKQDNIDGVYYYNYFSYDEFAGHHAKVAGKPLIGARAWLCGLDSDYKCLTQCGPGCMTRASLAELLSKLPRDRTHPNSYSLVSIDAWHTHLSDIQAVIATLGDAVRVVLPSQLVRELKEVL
eukprot:Sspe_Gene.40298::Locus_19448_Transcript_1_1_Confidence_1.000_Length_1982::g.40298::m.40298